MLFVKPSNLVSIDQFLRARDSSWDEISDIIRNGIETILTDSEVEMRLYLITDEGGEYNEIGFDFDRANPANADKSDLLSKYLRENLDPKIASLFTAYDHSDI